MLLGSCLDLYLDYGRAEAKREEKRDGGRVIAAARCWASFDSTHR